ncbi:MULTISPECIES: DUF2249 domain-containing protein [unclassified Luteimonas]
MAAIDTLSLQIHPFDARGIAKRFRHAAIFGAMDALQPGEGMRFVNDHDPLPLIAQLRERFGDALVVEYRQKEPGAVVIDFGVADVHVSGGSTCCGGCT